MKFFANISATFGSYPHILYELYNEPSWDLDWAQLKSYQTQHATPELKLPAIMEMVNNFCQHFSAESAESRLYNQSRNNKLGKAKTSEP